MGLQDSLRAELIKQFPTEVVETKDKNGNAFYNCPTCKREVAYNMEKCPTCSQVLNWETIRKEEFKNGTKKGVVEFALPYDFVPGNCRKCPLSYISKNGMDNVYTCPLNQRNEGCKLKIIEE